MKHKNFNSKALTLIRKSNKIILEYKDLNISEISKKEVIVKVEYSSINYKDHLICSGKLAVNKNIIVPGIDLAGKILKSNSKKFRVGDKVAAIAVPLGIQFNGGYSKLVKMHENFLDKIDNNISTKDLMIFGTAGFTAIYTCLKIKENFSNQKKLKILVTGGTSGVGLISLIFLNYLGHETYALINERNFKKKKKLLNKIGIKKILKTNEIIKNSKFPLLKEKYHCIIDCLGGKNIDLHLKQLKLNGSLYSVGNICGNNLNISIIPLILRGVKIIGINAESVSRNYRKKILKEIRTIPKKNIKHVFKTLMFKDLKNFFKYSQDKNLIGKKLVKFN